MRDLLTFAVMVVALAATLAAVVTVGRMVHNWTREEMETVSNGDRRLPRKPTSQELRELARFEQSDRERDCEEVFETLKEAWVAVFDHYMPDGPGLNGKVAVVIWPGGMEMVTTYTWTDNGVMLVV